MVSSWTRQLARWTAAVDQEIANRVAQGVLDVKSLFADEDFKLLLMSSHSDISSKILVPQIKVPAVQTACLI